MLKYHLQFWCLIIYKPFYQATVCCNTRYLLFCKTFFVTNSDQLQFFRHEFMNHYKMIDPNFHARKGRKEREEVKWDYGRIPDDVKGNAEYGRMLQPSQQHVGSCVRGVE